MIDADAHLLIVDDDERIRGLLQKFLARQGFLVSAARDAAHARRLLAGLEFDLIVLDVMMPGEDGVSFTRSLREEMDTLKQIRQLEQDLVAESHKTGDQRDFAALLDRAHKMDVPEDSRFRPTYDALVAYMQHELALIEQKKAADLLVAEVLGKSEQPVTPAPPVVTPAPKPQPFDLAGEVGVSVLYNDPPRLPRLPRVRVPGRAGGRVAAPRPRPAPRSLNGDPQGVQVLPRPERPPGGPGLRAGLRLLPHRRADRAVARSAAPGRTRAAGRRAPRRVPRGER